MKDIKIKVFIGTSGSGKTTYIVRNIIGNRSGEDTYINKLKMHIIDDTILFGHYNVDRRCKGCDTLSMSAINNIISTLEELILNEKYKLIVIDGDRINNRKMFDFLLKYKDMTEIYHIDTDIETVYNRLPNGNKKFIKTTQTKTLNMISLFKNNDFNIHNITNGKE